MPRMKPGSKDLLCKLSKMKKKTKRLDWCVVWVGEIVQKAKWW